MRSTGGIRADRMFGGEPMTSGRGRRRGGSGDEGNGGWKVSDWSDLGGIEGDHWMDRGGLEGKD